MELWFVISLTLGVQSRMPRAKMATLKRYSVQQQFEIHSSVGAVLGNAPLLMLIAVHMR